ncbi:hypothetical protein N9N67_11755, partial [Bacteriovoracaceae bacterium]|nr:hypothetical protein [Bacteriovoracaceae bacterium]
TFYFFIRHTPFWAVPIILISAEFSYVFWIRKKKKSLVFFISIAFMSLIFLIFYIYAGGPEKSVKKAIDLMWYYFYS